MTVADFGCGSGGFTFPLAKKLKEGFVYALDIQELPLSALKSRAQMENIKNIDFIRADIEKKIEVGISKEEKKLLKKSAEKLKKIARSIK